MPKRNDKKIKVVELFAGVGGFRIGLEGASDAFETIWNNQWEPSTVHQDASLVYRARFGSKGHSNKDINLVPTSDIPDHDLLVGGFPCQDYSVASTLSKAGGIEGKKGVLWWQIYRILNEKGESRPNYLFFENVDRLLESELVVIKFLDSAACAIVFTEGESLELAVKTKAVGYGLAVGSFAVYENLCVSVAVDIKKTDIGTSFY